MHLVVLTQVLDRRDAVLGFFHTWCELFAGSTDRLTVVAQRVGDVDLPANADVRSLGREDGASRSAMARRLLGVLATLTGRQRPTAILAHMVPKFVLYAAPVALPRRLPLYLWYTHKGVDRALRLASPLVRKVFTASEESFRLASAARKKVVTGHGIDCDHFAPGDDERPVDVLNVGRLAPSKGQDELLEAVATMSPRPVTQIAGEILLERDAPYRDALSARAAELGDGVELLGAVPYLHVAELMRRTKILVNTSRTGSVDKVVLEAMACGTVPLTCNESFRDLLGSELSERLMFPREDPAQLARALEGLLGLAPDERRELGARLRSIVQERHDVRRLIPRLVAEMEPRR